MIVSMQININHCRVWLFYNEMGAVAQCPNNWGVGSAFHPKKIHIFNQQIYIRVPVGGMQEMSFKITKLKVNTRWICSSSFDSCSENISSRTDNLFCFEDLQGNLYRLGAALNIFFCI